MPQLSPHLASTLRTLLTERLQRSVGLTDNAWSEWTLVAIRLRMVRAGQDASEVDALIAKARADDRARMDAAVAEITGAKLQERKAA